MHKLGTLLMAAGAILFTTQGMATMTQDEIREGYRKHAAMAQFHRWYQLYERPGGGVANALDILAEDVTVVSGLGTAKGHDEYAERVGKLPDTWKNAHFLKDSDVSVDDDGTASLTAAITYLNEGMDPEGRVRKADLTYSMTLVPGDGVLPVFRTIGIGQDSEGTAPVFRDAYGENRMLSLVHYWLALIEDPARDPEPVREILADDFSLNFSSGAITDFDGFEAWLAGPASAVAASTHRIGDFSSTVEDDGTYTITMTFDWAGILPDGGELVAKTGHTWRVENALTERFARIRTVDVEILEPFRPKPE